MRRLLLPVLALSLAVPAIAAAAPSGQSFGTHLSGDEEVPARDTDATGQATFKVTEDGTALAYRLIVANIDNVVASHIHLGPAGENGPVVAFLYGNQPAGGGRIQGVIAEGVITDADLVGPLSGQTLDDLLAHMRSGNAYVNVHTNDGVAPPNTGPGDFPGGEIRGQIEARAPKA